MGEVDHYVHWNGARELCEGQGPPSLQVHHIGGWVCIGVEYTTGFNKRLMCGRELAGARG